MQAINEAYYPGANATVLQPVPPSPFPGGGTIGKPGPRSGTLERNEDISVASRRSGSRNSCCPCCTDCCARGGYFRQAPAKFITDVDHRPLRINLIFNKEGCNKPGGLDDSIPDELFATGLDRKVATEYLHQGLTNANAPSNCCCAAMCVTSVVLFFWVPGILCACCAAGKREADDWNDRMLRWQNDFNSQVLQPRGMYCKTQSKCDAVYVYQSNGNGAGSTRKERYTERWIAFAMNPEEANLLYNEPHVFGDLEDWTCCCGVDEKRYCAHP
jgi:hypothetical protein